MQVSMERLLQGIVDYAGLFPPAKLPLKDAVERYAAALNGREEWLVSSFVCPVDSLAELGDVLTGVEGLDYFPVAAVGARSSSKGEWEDALESAVEAMNAFDRRMGDRAGIEGFEVRIPDCGGIAQYIRDLGGFAEADVFVEVPWDPAGPDALAAIAGTDWLFAKARTGGLEPSAFPTPFELGSFVRNCVDLELPFKLTAGLHHALPRWDETVGASMHGFLNVAASVVFALSEDLSAREIENVLTDMDPSGWSFDPGGFEWRGRRAELGEIDEARDLFLSFGSCSIDEPIMELEQLASRT